MHSRRVSGRRRAILAALFVVATPLFAIANGCGSGGATATDSGGSRSVHLLLTDSFRDDFDQVWVGIVRVELLAADGSSAILYENLSGFQIDARSLRDSGGPRYSLVGRQDIPDKVFTSARVTYRPPVLVTPKDSFTSRVLNFSPVVERSATGQPQTTFALKTPRRFSDGDSFIVDLDLENFLVDADSVTPALKEGTGEGLADAGRFDSRDFAGVIDSVDASDASGETWTFQAENTTFVVRTSSATRIESYDGGAARATSGTRADIRARLDVATGRLIASSVRLYPRTTTGNPRP